MMASDRRTGTMDRPAPREGKPRVSRLLEIFVLLELLCQILLLVPSIGAFRALVRLAVFGTSLLFLFGLAGKGRRHPSSRPAVWVIVILAVSMLHPTINALTSASAQVAMYVAILAPLFWVGRLQVDKSAMRRVLMMLWAFQTLSAAVGILQVYYPGRFQPSLSVVAHGAPMDYLKSLTFVNVYGQRVFRPTGLTDDPGGGAMAGLFAGLLGMTFFMSDRRRLVQAAGIASVFTGLAVIYLSQVRSVLLMCLFAMAPFIILLVWQNVTAGATEARRQGGTSRAMTLGVLAVAAVFISYSWAVSVGGGAVRKRVMTLTASDPGHTFHESRGRFLETLLYSYLPRYYLGAGLGRWGMMRHYFGDDSDSSPRAIWAEEQWTGWLLDGGVPLVFAYGLTILFALRFALKAATGRVSWQIGVWGALVVGYDLAALADTLDCPFFISQGGLDFWLLNAMLFSVYLRECGQGKPRRLTGYTSVGSQK